MTAIRFLMVVFLCLSVSACLNNDVTEIKFPAHTEGRENIGMGTIVFGISLEKEWSYKNFGISLDEYSLEEKNITGNCFHYNTAGADIPSDTQGVHYFVFNVPSGYYVYSPFNAASAIAPYNALAFFVPVHQTVYIGDFTYVGNHKVKFQRNLDAAEKSTKLLTETPLVPSETISVTSPHMFICTP